VPFGIPQYMQCIFNGLTSVLDCVPFVLADSKSVDLVVACDGFPSQWKLSVFFKVAKFITKELFKQLLIHTAV